MSSLPVPFGAHQSPRDQWFPAGGPGEPETFTLFGIRLDSASAEHVIIALWESCLTRTGLRVTLADVWMLLVAQRDHTVWEALSAADYVLPVGDDLVMRGLARRHARPIPPEDVLFDLFDASASNNRVVALVGPSEDISTHLPLIQAAWPELRLVGINRPTGEDAEANDMLLGQVNVWRPDLLIIGGWSPWQERWIQTHRGGLEVGATLMLPGLGAPLAAVAQRAGLPMANLRRLRREAALRRALSTTVGQSALVPANRIGSWLREARSGLVNWSEDLRARRQPEALRRLGETRLPLGLTGRVHITQVHDTEEMHAIQNLGASPLERLTPASRVPSGPRPGLPALPPGTHRPFGIAVAGDHDDGVADQPTTLLSGAELRERIAADSSPGAVPLIVTGYIVETRDVDEAAAREGEGGAAGTPNASTPSVPSASAATPAMAGPDASGTSEASPASPGPAATVENGAEPQRLPARESTAAQLAPTRRLSPRRLPREETGLPPTRRLRASAGMRMDPADAGMADSGVADSEAGALAPASPLTTNPLPPASTTPLPPASTTPLSEASPGDSLSAAMSPVAGRRTSRHYWTRAAHRQQSRHSRRRSGGRR